MEPTSTIAPWCTDEDVRGQVAWGANEDPPSDEQVDQGIAAASEALYVRSGRQFTGPLTETVRPLAGLDCWHLILDGRYGYDSTAPPFGLNTRSAASELSLPAPVWHVADVTVDGTSLPDTSWRVDNWRLLVRTDGGVWPATQNVTLASTEPGTWSVTYTHGVQVPFLGRIAAARLAAELAKHMAGLECVVPDRVTSVQQQGFSVALLAPPEDWITGIREVSTFLKAFNPNGLRRPPGIRHPSGPKLRRTTSTPGS